MTKPRIELRKVKLSKTLSEETPAYTADVWVDGALFAHVSNHGTGGPDMVYPPKGTAFNDKGWNGELEALNKRIGATFPKWGIDSDAIGGGEVPERLKKEAYERDLEFVCHELLDEHETAADLRRALARKFLFKRADGHVYEVKKPADPVQAVKVLTAIKRKNDGVTTLNEMAFDEALAAYKSAA